MMKGIQRVRLRCTTHIAQVAVVGRALHMLAVRARGFSLLWHQVCRQLGFSAGRQQPGRCVLPLSMVVRGLLLLYTGVLVGLDLDCPAGEAMSLVHIPQARYSVSVILLSPATAIASFGCSAPQLGDGQNLESRKPLDQRDWLQLF